MTTSPFTGLMLTYTTVAINGRQSHIQQLAGRDGLEPPTFSMLQEMLSAACATPASSELAAYWRSFGGLPSFSSDHAVPIRQPTELPACSHNKRVLDSVNVKF